MPIKYQVKKGDCISSIALEYGFNPDTIWRDPLNTELRNQRGSSNILSIDDVVMIPDKHKKDFDANTSMTHRFRRKGVPERLRIKLLDASDEPRKHLPYVLVIEGQNREGKTNMNGELNELIPPDARDGILILGENRDEEYNLDLGELDPISKTKGLQARLSNLGYDCGNIDGDLGPRTRAAIKEFQTAQEQEPTGNPEEGTQESLKKLHAS